MVAIAPAAAVAATASPLDDDVDPDAMLEASIVELRAYYTSVGMLDRASKAERIVNKYGIDVWAELITVYPSKAAALRVHMQRAREAASAAMAADAESPPPDAEPTSDDDSADARSPPVGGTVAALPPPSPEQLHADAVARAAASASRERARRAAALARLEADAAAAPAGSVKRLSWEDFKAAQVEVERLREAVRRGGRGRYRDGWSGSTAALGRAACCIGLRESEWSSVGLRNAPWADFQSLAPFPVLVDDGFSLGDVLQGRLGNSFFLAALGCLLPAASSAAGAGGVGEGFSLASDVLDSILVTGEDNAEGVFCVRFWLPHARRWEHVFVDDLIPVEPNTFVVASTPRGSTYATTAQWKPSRAAGRFHRPFAARSSNMNELWPCLLEKAWSKFIGTYEVAGNRGTYLETWQRYRGRVRTAQPTAFPLRFILPNSLTGVFIPSFGEWDESSVFWSNPASFWSILQEYASSGSHMMTATTSDNEAVEIGGLRRNHTYTILRVFPGPSVAPTDPPHPLLVQLRNPQGMGEWMGSFSDADAANWTPELRAATGYDPDSFDNSDDGVFWMEAKPFHALFAAIFITPITDPALPPPRPSCCDGRNFWIMRNPQRSLLVGAALVFGILLAISAPVIYFVAAALKRK